MLPSSAMSITNPRMLQPSFTGAPTRHAATPDSPMSSFLPCNEAIMLHAENCIILWKSIHPQLRMHVLYRSLLSAEGAAHRQMMGAKELENERDGPSS